MSKCFSDAKMNINVLGRPRSTIKFDFELCFAKDEVYFAIGRGLTEEP